MVRSFRSQQDLSQCRPGHPRPTTKAGRNIGGVGATASAASLDGLLRLQEDPLSAGIQAVPCAVLNHLQWYRASQFVVYLGSDAEQIVGSHVHHQKLSRL